MNEVTAKVNGLHIAPRKVRLIADDIRGKNVGDVLVALTFREKKASLPIRKLIDSAIANAKENAKVANPESEMFVKTITVDEGRPFKRYRPRARGRAVMFKRRTSHVTLILDVLAKKEKKVVKTAKTTKTTKTTKAAKTIKKASPAVTAKK